ncbi:MAG: type IV secretion system DNA-binding domain-containing protein [Parcubacteria group bacterium]|nr:type IV secretion system DNA-binding domain-containing protein [Parcubacteria group bacterium]
MAEQQLERIPIVNPEQAGTPDRSSERHLERASETAAPRQLERVSVRQMPSTGKPRAVSDAPAPVVAVAKSETLVQIEQVMEERLQDAYQRMTPEARLAFKQKGEETATQIERLLEQVKVQSKKIFQLLFAWLKIIPGVNKYFLEQEAKLKTDELMRLKDEADRGRGRTPGLYAILLQIPVAVDPYASQQAAAEFFTDPLVVLVLVIFGLLILVLIAFLITISVLRRGKSLPKAFQKKLLMISVPKESLQQEKEKASSDMQSSIKESIGVAEILFSSLGGMKPAKGMKTWLWGREDHIGFEIVAHDRHVTFYAAAPDYLRVFVEQQIQAQYPQAQIEEVDDYNVFQATGVVMGANLTFERETYFPIKTYQEMEGDPLNALLAPLAQLPAQDGAVIQFLIRPVPRGWQALGRKLASAMRQGKKLDEAKRYIHRGALAELFASGKKKDGQLPEKYQLSPLEEEMIKRLETKSSKAGMEANVRLIVSAPNEAGAQGYIDTLAGSFAQYNIYEYGNSFKLVQPRKQEALIEDYIFRRFNNTGKIIANTEEMASLFHFPLPQTEIVNIRWLAAKRAPAPLTLPTEGLLLGYNEYRNKKTDVRILREDRRRHTYIIGKSGSGKSWLLANMARQDIANGEGVCVIDPHGDLVDDVLAAIPKERVDDVIVFDPADAAYPLGMNLLEYDPRYPEQKTFVINEMIKIFDKLYDLRATGGPIFEQYMRNAMLLIMDHPESGSTLMEISKVVADEQFRAFKLSKCRNQVVVDFWRKEAEKAGGEAALANMVPYITSKLNQFVSNDIMRPIIGQQKSAFQFRELMDSRKILLVKLSKGKIGDINAHLLGMVIVGKILMAALSRTDQPKDQRKDFYLYIDEFQNFTTDSIAIILSEARKYMLDLIIAHQYLGQLVKNNDTAIRDAVFGNVGTIAAFKIGVEDAETLAKEFAPVFNQYDVLNIEQYTAYMKLLVNNATVRPFSMRANTLAAGHSHEVTSAILELSRARYGRGRDEIEQEILDRARVTVKDPFEDL